ncbi:MAG: hypothetical protein ACR2RL_05455 [Gammaproteobacteria bacterium]
MRELEASRPSTKFRKGWISGVISLFLGVAGLAAVVCLRYPQVLTVPEIRAAIDVGMFRVLLHGLLIVGFLLASISLILRQNKVLGLSVLAVILIAVGLGGSGTRASSAASSGVYFSG